MSYLGREGSPLAQRAVNKNAATAGVPTKSVPRVDRSLSASPLPEVELSGPVAELVLENEKLIGETIVLRGSYKALSERCSLYATENAALKDELNMLRNELGLAHDAVTNKDGSVVNYKKECERLRLVVDRQAEEVEKLQAIVNGTADSITAGATIASGGSAAKAAAFTESIANEIASATRQAGKLVKDLQHLEASVASVPVHTRASAATQNQWVSEVKSLQTKLQRVRDAKEESKAGSDPVNKAILPVRELCVDSVELSIALINQCIAARVA